MRWLQWSTNDLKQGLGGVEVHARSLQIELRALGIECELSSDPSDLEKDWDVIHTHGSSPAPAGFKTRAIRVHTVHGSTIGRMSACGEWLWPGGYAAYLREYLGIVQSQVVLSVHPGVHFLGVAKRLGKIAEVCWNGWDSSYGNEELPGELRAKLESFGPFFCFIGRGDDRVKNTGLLQEAMDGSPGLKIAAAPGAGFQESAQVLKTGRLSPSQVQHVMRMSQGLVLSSHYEGLPLVVLEALGAGVPVLTTRVGGLNFLPGALQGLRFVDADAVEWKRLLQSALSHPIASDARAHRAVSNQRLLPRWRDVAQVAQAAVTESKKR